MTHPRPICSPAIPQRTSMRAMTASSSAAGSSRPAPDLPVTGVRNGAAPQHRERGGTACNVAADGGHPARSRAGATAPPAAITRHAFERLARDLGMGLAGLSTRRLTDLRNALIATPPDASHPQPLSAHQHQCLMAGLNLELLQHPRVWNEGTGDLVPFIIETADWPEGRALRIVDTDTGAIHLYRRGQPELFHYPGGPELPEAEDDEIILLRHERHFSLLRRDQDAVIDTVAADGDCFFSCLSKALGSTDVAVSNLALRRDLVELLWTRPDALQAVATLEGPLQDPRAAAVVQRASAPSSVPGAETERVAATPPPQPASALCDQREGHYTASMTSFMAGARHDPMSMAIVHRMLVEDCLAAFRAALPAPSPMQQDGLLATLEQVYEGCRQQSLDAWVKARQDSMRAGQGAMTSTG